MVDVLVIDSEPLVRRLVVDMLEEIGLRVVAATAEVAEARALLDKGDFPPSAVLIIATRPGFSRSGGGLNGRAVAAELRQWLGDADDRTTPRSLGVVYIGEHASAVGGDALGPSEQILTEPFGHGRLARAVFAVLGREVPHWLLVRSRAHPAMRA